jgi:hypothetical protein
MKKITVQFSVKNLKELDLKVRQLKKLVREINNMKITIQKKQ